METGVMRYEIRGPARRWRKRWSLHLVAEAPSGSILESECMRFWTLWGARSYTRFVLEMDDFETPPPVVECFERDTP